MVATSALLGALALVAPVAALVHAGSTPSLYPHVPLVLWSQRATLHAQQAYVDAVFDERETANVLHTVLARDTAKDTYNVLDSEAAAAPAAEALCVFVREHLASSQLAELGADSFVRSAVKRAASSVVVAHTTRPEPLATALAGVDHAVVALDEVEAWIQSPAGQTALANGQTDLIVVSVPEDGLTLREADAKIQRAATALLAAAPADRGVDFALTGNAAEKRAAKGSFTRRGRRLATGQAVTATSIICDAGSLIGLSSSGKAYCFSHYVHMTPEILTALIFGFFFLFLAYVGIGALHAIQTPLRYPLHGPPKGKEF